MDSDKRGSSDNSSDQENDHSLSPESSNDGTGRSYECNFCKRGFTNAQALGGHMNIHRKDKEKAKAKAKKQNSSVTAAASTKSNQEDHFLNASSSKCLGLISNQQAHYRYPSFGFSMDYNYHHQYQSSTSNPNFPYGYGDYFPGYLGAQQPNLGYSLHDEHLRANLNVRDGSSEMESSSDAKMRDGNYKDWFENEVDLELRLGHYP